MKKYKLLKEYPVISEFIKRGETVNFYKDQTYLKLGKLDGLTVVLLHSEVKENPEFWKNLSVLTTTEDGVDIYEGDEYYVPQHPFYEEEIVKYVATPSKNYKNDNSKRFSTLGAARNWLANYLHQNEEKFSRKEIRKAFKEVKKYPRYFGYTLQDWLGS